MFSVTTEREKWRWITLDELQGERHSFYPLESYRVCSGNTKKTYLKVFCFR